jgi:hypothetical protein
MRAALSARAATAAVFVPKAPASSAPGAGAGGAAPSASDAGAGAAGDEESLAGAAARLHVGGAAGQTSSGGATNANARPFNPYAQAHVPQQQQRGTESGRATPDWQADGMVSFECEKRKTGKGGARAGRQMLGRGR